MRRAAIATFFLFFAALTVQAQYRLVFADGSVLDVDKKPDLRSDPVVYQRDGGSYLISLGRLDLPSTEAANNPTGTALGDPSGPVDSVGGTNPAGPRRFTDEDLKPHTGDPSKSSVSSRPNGPAASPPPVGAAPPKSAEALATWQDLTRERRALLDRREALDERASELKRRLDDLEADDASRRRDYDRYPTDPSVMATSMCWAREFREKKSAIEDELYDIGSNARDIDREVAGLDRDIRDMTLSE